MDGSLFEQAVNFISSLPYWGVLSCAFFITYIENIFPPSPSDLLLVFVGTLCGVGTAGFQELLAVATLGSVLGFATMYFIGTRVDRNVVESGRYRFIPVEALRRAESWFRRWGYTLIVVNRFLAGTRAVVAFMAGMSELKFRPTLALSTVSALIWNAILLYAGMQLGKNWRSIDDLLSTYSVLITALVAIIIVLFLSRRMIMKSKSKQAESND